MIKKDKKTINTKEQIIQNHYKSLLTALGYDKEIQKEFKNDKVARKARSLLKQFPKIQKIKIFKKKEI